MQRYDVRFNLGVQSRIYTITIFAGVLLLAPPFFPLSAAENDAENTMNHPQKRAEQIEIVVSWVADVGTAVRDKMVRNQTGEEVLNKLKKPLPTVDKYMAEPLVVYHAIVSWLSGDKIRFSDLQKAAKSKGVFCPELLLYKVYLIGEGGGDKSKRRIEAWNEHGRLVPISWYGQDKDNRLAPAGKINPPPPSVPILSNIGARLAEVGALYEKMGFERDAINSYLEALYSSPFAETGEKRGDIWLRIAKLEAQQGQKALALRAYLKAAYSDKKYTKPAVEGVQQAARKLNVRKQVSSTTQPTLDKKTVLRIAALYRKLNLHPLALSLIVKTEKQAGVKLSKEKETVRREWHDIVKRNAHPRGPNCHILGHKVSDVKDWAQVRVLRPSDSFWKPKVLGTTSNQRSEIKRKPTRKPAAEPQGGTGPAEGDKDYDTDNNPSSNGDNAGQMDTNRPLELTFPVD